MGCVDVILYDVAVILQLTVARSIAMYRVFSELARDVALSGEMSARPKSGNGFSVKRMRKIACRIIFKR